MLLIPRIQQNLPSIARLAYIGFEVAFETSNAEVQNIKR